MGNDINCGMRFYTTDLSEEQIQEKFQAAIFCFDMIMRMRFMSSMCLFIYIDRQGISSRTALLGQEYENGDRLWIMLDLLQK